MSLNAHLTRHVTVKSWGGLHPKLFCRGRFADFAKPTVIRCQLIPVTVTRLPSGRKAPGPLWLWRAGPGTPDLELIWRACLHRFDIEHTYPGQRAKTLQGPPRSSPADAPAPPQPGAPLSRRPPDIATG